jgi:hypothetical protein
MKKSPKTFHVTWHLTTLDIFIKYKVKDGDSLKSIAESIGLTWQELARLNWGTDDPNEVHWYLKNYFVCTKKAADGYNFAFSSTDEPGFLVLPRPQLLDHTGGVRGAFPVSRFIPD